MLSQRHGWDIHAFSAEPDRDGGTGDLAKPGGGRTLGSAEDRWMPSPVTAEGSGRGREIPPDIPRR
jgi:hypothetical protein